MKYEFRSSMGRIGIAWAAMLGMAIIAGVFSRIGLMKIAGNGSSLAWVLSLMKGISMFLYVSLVVAAIVVTVMMIISRFKSGLLGDEGYLMHTLPVSKTELIASKGLVAAIILLGSMLAISLSITLMNSIINKAQVAQNIKAFFKAFFEPFAHEPIGIIVLIEGVILFVACLLIIIYKVYLAMSIAQLSDDHRGLIAIGAYFGINIAIAILGTIVSILTVKLSIGTWVVELIKRNAVCTQINLVALMAFIVLAIVLVILHVATERILSNKLNLQ